MKNETHAAEIAYLEKVNRNLNESIHSQQFIISNLFNQITNLQQYFIDSRNEIDNDEIANIKTELSIAKASLTYSKSRLDRLKKINKSPYFGRIDFTPAGEDQEMIIYIGLHDFQHNREHMIYDWRAPVSSMFYDFKLGEANYKSPNGIKYGTLSLKRQYKISAGCIKYMFDTSLNINDDILQQELSNATSNRMRNIINTIQSEQNNIIRNEEDLIMIIQGHAGSGKTSIALHRIAFLLYRHRQQLKSQDILIISPNKIFSDYISNVLPELGEEALTQMSIEEVIRHYFDPELDFTPSYESQFDSDTALSDYMSSLQIIADLDKYTTHLQRNQFTPRPLTCRKITLTPEELLKYSRRSGGKTIAERKERLYDYLVDEFKFRTNQRITKQEKLQIKEQLNAMYSTIGGIKDYIHFFEFINKPELAPERNTHLPYLHIIPYLYLAFKLKMIAPASEIRHIVIDEMQDYAPIMYKLLNDFFKSSMTILGDICQSINACSHSSIEELQAVLPGANTLYLNKSYRSTFEIMTLAQHVLPSDNIEIMSRHGAIPSICCCTEEQSLQKAIANKVSSLIEEGTESIAVITRTETYARALYKFIRPLLPEAHLLTQTSTSFEKGVSIVSSSIAKGLEFDHVIIPDADSDNYHTDIDKHHLYVAITRSKHSLAIYYKGNLSPFLENAPANYNNMEQ